VRLKGSNQTCSRAVLLVFQFLLVRLKGAEKLLSPVIFMFISIPFGAIKSLTVFGLIFFIAVFQFLLVRLKEYLEKNINKLPMKFQFLLVRLKEFHFRQIKGKMKDFNSFWCD